MLVAGAECMQCKGQGSGPPSGQSGPHKWEVTRFTRAPPSYRPRQHLILGRRLRVSWLLVITATCSMTAGLTGLTGGQTTRLGRV